MRSSLRSTAQPRYISFPTIFGGCFAKVSIGYTPTRPEALGVEGAEGEHRYPRGASQPPPGVITPAQPKVPEAKRQSQGVPGEFSVRCSDSGTGAQGPEGGWCQGALGPLELSALAFTCSLRSLHSCPHRRSPRVR